MVWWVGLLALALVLGGWLKLAPTAAERRVAALRAQALAAGLRLHWLPPSAVLALGAERPLTWYELPGDTGVQAEQLFVPGAGAQAARPPGLPALLPAGVRAVRINAGGRALAWDEADPAALPAVIAALRAWAAA